MEDKKIEIVYSGKRLHENKMLPTYRILAADGTTHNVLTFGKMVCIHSFGAIIQCGETEKGVKGPYTVIGNADPAKITEWSIAQKADEVRHQSILASKIKPDAHIDQLIAAVIHHTDSATSRRRVAMYVYNKIAGI